MVAAVPFMLVSPIAREEATSRAHSSSSSLPTGSRSGESARRVAQSTATSSRRSRMRDTMCGY